jgi:hypothetical protein
MFEPKLSQFNTYMFHDPCNKLHRDRKLRHVKQRTKTSIFNLPNLLLTKLMVMDPVD